jgi:site-specific recombinase
MLDILDHISAHPDDAALEPLVRLAAALRPIRLRDPGLQVRRLTGMLAQNPRHAATLKHYLLGAMASRRQTSLYTDTGILSGDGFFTELFRRLSYRVLPPALDDIYLQDCMDRILDHQTDRHWITAVPEQDWLALYQVLADAPQPAGVTPQPAGASLNRQELLEAVQTLSTRISAMGLEPALIRAHPELEEFESPFLVQNTEVHSYLEAMRSHLAGGPAPDEDARHLLVMLDQCNAVIARIRRNALKIGTSVALTYLLVRMSQSLDRLAKLLALIDQDAMPQQQARDGLALAMELVDGHGQRYALHPLVAANIDLLARNVTENASRTGEHYIAENRSDYLAMLRSAAGAGAIIGFMALGKVLLSRVHAAPLVDALLLGLNYALGFMLIHVLHLTVATKQPAMTASRIAAGLQSPDGRTIDVDSLADLVQNVMRTQFVAVLGNLLTAIPAAFLLGTGWLYLSGHHLVTPEKAAHMLHDIDPLASLALPHAALAGVCLFLAGLISGYYDNKAAYTRFALRVERLRWLRQLLGTRGRARLARYLENNLGGLMGNFFFGFMLVSVAMVGYLLGLPLDVRHVTLSATYFAFAAAALDLQLGAELLTRSLAGIAAIGVVNLLVSFSLALFVALRSRQVHFRQGWSLVKNLGWRMLRRPLGFFIPPRDPAAKVQEPLGKSI